MTEHDHTLERLFPTEGVLWVALLCVAIPTFSLWNRPFMTIHLHLALESLIYILLGTIFLVKRHQNRIRKQSTRAFIFLTLAIGSYSLTAIAILSFFTT
ncbi:hypothetical protein [Geomicrobium sp. JCM 19055]|uniref:hypothetical protein n=1 Tax=Geomicrobium sp. JCM 19055 TaxID=1460649 RepID=UPI00045ED3EC|nr:hypothetical protein [Geomicrobium sp. JCM 19055]GAJ98874.1 hypothetical protein JCM19055_1836 [Geomicrobium sp. JCM 19055]